MLISCILVAIGGGLGAVGRFLLGFLPFEGLFPFATLLTNFLGAVLIGFFCGWSDWGKLNPRQLLLLKTGFCGGFTTFSTFSLESVTLLEKGETMTAVLYMVVSMLLCLTGVVIGRYVAKICFN